MTTADAATTREPGPRLAIAIVAIIIGTVVGIGGAVIGVTRVVHDIVGTKYTTPADIHAHLGSGTWEVYVADDDGFNAPQLTPADVIVTGPDGNQIRTRDLPDNVTESEGTGSTTYLGEIEFTVPTAGEYEVQVNGPPGNQILLSRSFGQIAKHAAKWFVLMGIGFLIGLLGVILLIVGIVRRRSFRRGPPMYVGGGYQPAGGFPPASYPATGYPATGYPPAQPQTPAAPAPGWYPDPSIPGTQRYWDGTRWTDQTHTPETPGS
jgi:Protein of unknown function (DUF2510)